MSKEILNEQSLKNHKQNFEANEQEKTKKVSSSIIKAFLLLNFLIQKNTQSEDTLKSKQTMKTKEEHSVSIYQHSNSQYNHFMILNEEKIINIISQFSSL